MFWQSSSLESELLSSSPKHALWRIEKKNWFCARSDHLSDHSNECIGYSEDGSNQGSMPKLVKCSNSSFIYVYERHLWIMQYIYIYIYIYIYVICANTITHPRQKPWLDIYIYIYLYISPSYISLTQDDFTLTRQGRASGWEMVNQLISNMWLIA